MSHLFIPIPVREVHRDLRSMAAGVKTEFQKLTRNMSSLELPVRLSYFLSVAFHDVHACAS
jgi:hypothetical protein